jgi:predicted transcriptional regulator
MRKKLTAIRLKPEQVKKLAKIAVREDVPVSWLIRKAIDEFLKRKSKRDAMVLRAPRRP